jgi:hypothetical protein
MRQTGDIFMLKRMSEGVVEGVAKGLPRGLWLKVRSSGLSPLGPLEFAAS